jgi:dihydroorotase
MATYDLLLKGGHVLDPGSGLDGTMDIGVAGNTIAAISPDIPETEAATVLRVGAPNRYVVPGLVDIHTHVAHGATTPGVGMQCCDPDAIGVQSGVTTVVDCGSVGVANVGTFPVHILPRAKTRVLCYLNAGTFAHTTPRFADVGSLEEVDEAAIASCIEANPGLVSGIKLRLVGPIMVEQGEEVVRRSLAVARRHQIPLMVHIGDPRAGEGGHPERVAELTRFLLRSFQEGDILTHLCTPHIGGVMDSARQPVPELREARANGVVLDSALGMGNFGYEVAREQAQLGVQPDSISSDLTAMGQSFHSLMECMAKFMAVGYSLADVVAMTTHQAAAAIGLSGRLGALQVGREADITVMDVVEGDFVFRDTTRLQFRGQVGIVPVQTVRAGELFAPRWGTHPWGWLPESVA